MCPSLRLLNTTRNGKLTFCNSSKLFQIIFNNLCFEFFEWELDSFVSYLEQLRKSTDYKLLRDIHGTRSIPISVGNKYFVILVSPEELNELLSLVSKTPSEPEFLKAKEINYRILEN